MDLLDGLEVAKVKRFDDNRGYFKDVNVLWDDSFVQQNESMSKKNVVRGLHFQHPNHQRKIVRVVKGSILDVCVDLRNWSSTFLRHSKIELSSENDLCLYIPAYFAHGFLALEEETIITYHCDEFYKPDQQCGIKWNDDTLNIDWGIEHPILSEKDTNLPNIKEALKILYKDKEEVWQKY